MVGGEGERKREELLSSLTHSSPLSFSLSASAERAQCWAPRLVASTFDRWDAVHFAGISTSGYLYGERRACTHAHTQARRYAHTRTRALQDRHASTHTRTHAHAHSHTSGMLYALLESLSIPPSHCLSLSLSHSLTPSLYPVVLLHPPAPASHL